MDEELLTPSQDRVVSPIVVGTPLIVVHDHTESFYGIPYRFLAN